MNEKEIRERFYEKFLFKIHHPHTNEVGYADRICDHFLAEMKAEREKFLASEIELLVKLVEANNKIIHYQNRILNQE